MVALAGPGHRLQPVPFAKEEQETMWTREYAVESASLDPHYDDAFFRNLPFPSGTIVYEVKDDEITNNYSVGAPQRAGIQPDLAMAAHWKLGSNGGVWRLVAAGSPSCQTDGLGRSFSENNGFHVARWSLIGAGSA